MKKSLLVFALLVWVGVQTVMAQTTIKGRVLDGEEHNEPSIGASVKVSGTTAGTQTDLDGNFEIELPANSNGMLEISYVGRATQTVKAKDGMEVILKNDQNALTEVVISTPYGPPVSKQNYVGAADVVTNKKIANTPVSDVTKAIEGAAPGVQVTNGSGEPGSGASIRIRGRGSISGNTSPLIVLDGAPYDGDITSINPSDIENINILKDAMATSLYGARGANGVIIINTKRGKAGEGKARITVDAKAGTVTRGLPNYNVMTDPKEYYETAWQGQYNKLLASGYYKTPLDAGYAASGQSSIGNAVLYNLGYNNYYLPGVGDSVQDAFLLDPVTGKLNPNAQLKYHDDWQKEIERVGVRQDYNVNVSGASDKSDYFLSAGYLKEDGYIVNGNYSRFTSRLNVNTQATDWLRMGLNVSGSMSTKKGIGFTSSANTGNPVFVALSMAPIYPVYWRDSLNNKVIDPLTGKDKLDYGNPFGDPDYSMGQRGNVPGNNILGQLFSDESRTEIKNVVVVPYLEAKFLKNFTFTTRLNASYTNLYDMSYTNRTHGILKDKGQLSKYSQNYFSYTWNQQLSYQKTFNDVHELTVTAAHENYYYNTGYISGTISGFPTDGFREFDIATGTPIVSSKTDNDRMESYLAIANYAYKGRYLLQGNIRRDGLSRFAPDVRWGTFAGLGGAWVISEEAFMKDVKWVNNLKLKASYGTNGNNGVNGTNGLDNYYAYQGLFDLSRPNGSNSAAIPLSLPSLSLTWEKTKAFNVGTEFTLFNNILSGEINVYNKVSDALYYNVPNPPSTGFISQIKNTATMYNRGLELNFYVTPVQTKNFSWTFNTNWSKNINKITKLADGIDSVVTTNNTILKPGYDFSTFYLVQSAGVDSKNGNELYMWYDTLNKKYDTTRLYNDRAQITGRQYFKNVNATPLFQGAITNTLKYKGFEFSFLISYSVGGKYYDATYQSLMMPNLSKIGGSNFSKDILNSWTPENPNASLPRIEYDNTEIGNVSSRFLIDASYINIRNINLRYTLAQNLIKKAGLNSASAYVAMDNVALFSKRKGMNPQGSFDGQVAYPYNPSRTIMFGLTLGL